MTFNYARSATTAQRLIAKFGADATLVQVSRGADAWTPTITETTTTIKAVDLNREVRDAAGMLTGQTRRTLYISTSAGVTPAKGDKVAVGTAKAAYDALTTAQKAAAASEIVAVRTLAPAGTVVLHEVDLAQ